MAATAFVLIESAVGKTKEIVVALRKVSEVKSVNAVTGPYDIIVVVEGPDLTAVGNLVTSEIHTISGVIRTVTCLAIDLS